MSDLREDQLEQLRAVFDLFDADGDGLLEVEEIGAIWSACGNQLTEAEVLDLVTELKPDLRRLPFEEFVNMLSRPMCDRPTLERRVRESFPTFSGGQPEITVETLEAAMTKLGRPVSSLVAKEMLDEADSVKFGDLGGDGSITLAEFCAVNSVSAPPPAQ